MKINARKYINTNKGVKFKFGKKLDIRATLLSKHMLSWHELDKIFSNQVTIGAYL